MKKIDLKNAAEVFGLWDNVYGKDAIRALENSMRWDPSKKGDKDKDKKVAKKVSQRLSFHYDLIMLRKWSIVGNSDHSTLGEESIFYVCSWHKGN